MTALTLTQRAPVTVVIRDAAGRVVNRLTLDPTLRLEFLGAFDFAWTRELEA